MVIRRTNDPLYSRARGRQLPRTIYPGEPFRIALPTRYGKGIIQMEGPIMALEKEMETFHQELPRLLAEGKKGKFVLIQGDNVSGYYDSTEAGLNAGYEHFGLGPFL